VYCLNLGSIGESLGRNLTEAHQGLGKFRGAISAHLRKIAFPNAATQEGVKGANFSDAEQFREGGVDGFGASLHTQFPPRFG
jgi:hypothetical protein